MDVKLTLNKLSTENFTQVQETRKLVKDLFAPRAAIFWTDLLLSAMVGWVTFAIACLAEPLSWQMLVFGGIAALAFYRSLAFIHELTHLRENALPGFARAWDLLVGVPLLLPSFTYVGVHADHHRLSVYGTPGDPEYMPFAGKKGAILFFLVHNFLLPLFLVLRFLILSPLGLLLPNFHHFLECHASSISMNLTYCRQVSDLERARMKRTELLILGAWAIALSLAWQGVLSWHIFAIWYVMMGLIFLMNSLRTLGAHRYGSDGSPMRLEEQLLDSIDTPGRFWSVLWAPVGLRYHALHHYFPSMPYHNLPIAYQRLIQALPPDASYCLASSPSLWSSLQQLWKNPETL